MGDPRDRIISAIADRECKRISRKVIRTLQTITEGMQSGVDTVLKNVWDEVCVQVQGQQSVMWETYLDLIGEIIAQHMSALSEEAKQAIWLQTNNGMDWDSDENDDEGIPYADDDIADYVLEEYVLSSAANWTNSRIEKHRRLEIEFG